MARPRPSKPGTAHKSGDVFARISIHPLSLSQNQNTTLRDSQIDQTHAAQNQRGLKRRLLKEGGVHWMFPSSARMSG
jgi:hypothetical protein